jgi:hypothetical protein
MVAAHTFEHFESELNRLVASFGKRLAELKQPGYAEAQLRDDFLNPFFRALGCPPPFFDILTLATLLEQKHSGRPLAQPAEGRPATCNLQLHG